MTSEPSGHLGDLGTFIKDQRELARLSVRRLADMAGVSNPYLSQIERGLRRPSADILRQIASALRISAESLYVRAGILDEREDGDDLDVPEAVRRDQHLTEEQKRALLAVYEGFRASSEPRVPGPPGPAARLGGRRSAAPGEAAPSLDVESRPDRGG